MFVRSRPDLDFTLFYFDKHGSYDDFIRQLRRYIEDGPTRLELFYFADDARLITPTQVKEIVPIASNARKSRPPGGKTALLFGREVLYGLGRVYRVAENRILQRSWTTELFKELPAAEKWLGLTSDVVREMIARYNCDA